MIRLRHETLPAGLSAIVRRRADGELDVIVSTALSAGRQRAAVRAGLRTMQPARRRVAPLPVPALITLALGGTWLRAIGRLLRLRPAATMAVAATSVAAAVAIVVAPHLHGPAVARRNPAGATVAPPPGSAAGPARATPSPPTAARPLPSAMPVAAHSSTAATAPPVTPQPYPATSSAPQQTPGAPTPSGKPGGICLEVLGLRICV